MQKGILFFIAMLGLIILAIKTNDVINQQLFSALAIVSGVLAFGQPDSSYSKKDRSKN